MRFTKVLLSTAVGMAVILAPAAASAKDDYPPPAPSLTVSVGTIVAGGTVVISGSGYGSDETVSVDVSYQQGVAMGRAPQESMGGIQLAAWETVVAGSDGSFQASVTLTTPGVATITATGDRTGRSASVTVTVVSSASNTQPPSNALPTTGTSAKVLGSAIGGGIAAILLGTLLVALSMRHRRRRIRGTR